MQTFGNTKQKAKNKKQFTSDSVDNKNSIKKKN